MSMTQNKKVFKLMFTNTPGQILSPRVQPQGHLLILLYLVEFTELRFIALIVNRELNRVCNKPVPEEVYFRKLEIAGM